MILTIFVKTLNLNSCSLPGFILGGKMVQLKKLTVWKSAAALLGILLIISLFTDGFGITGAAIGLPGALSSDEAAEKTVDYINENLLQPGTTATLVSVEDSGDLYNVKLRIGNQLYDSYVTKDGSLLFPNAVNLDAVVEEPEQPTADYPKNDKPDVLMFVMTFCPYGQQAETGLGPVAELLGNKINFEPHFVIYSNYRGGGPNYCLDDENKYCSMHGIDELNEGVRQLCIWKYEKSKFWDYVSAINSKCSLSNIETCWEGIAQDAGINVERIKTCQENEALSLLRTEVELGEEHGASGSPTIVINGKSYSGARTPNAFQEAICSAFNKQPSECSEEIEGGSEGAAATGSC